MHSATIPSLPLFKETSWKYRIHKNMHACSTRDHTRKYLIPARPDPFEFRTRPTLPVQILNPSDPPRTSQNLPEPSPPRAGTLPVGSGRVGLQYSTLDFQYRAKRFRQRPFAGNRKKCSCIDHRTSLDVCISCRLIKKKTNEQKTRRRSEICWAVRGKKKNDLQKQ